ncbi:hypothetical protein D3C85_1075650 [compost metagenome]
MSRARPKSVAPTPASGGWISTSVGSRVASWTSELLRVIRVTDWLSTSTTVASSLRGRSGVPMSTTITRSTPISRATSTGMLSTMPPSTSSRPFTSTGANTAGIDMLARIAWGRWPRRNTTFSPVAISVATARKGMANWSKSRVSLVCTSRLSSNRARFWPWITPSGRPRLPSSRKLRRCLTRKSRSSCLRRKGTSCRGGSSDRACCQSRWVAIFSSSST